MLDRIKELCKINDLNTCWSVLALCEGCSSKGECEDQSPLIRLKEISKLVDELEVEYTKLKLQATSLDYANEIATLETENEYLMEENKRLKFCINSIKNQMKWIVVDKCQRILDTIEHYCPTERKNVEH